MSQQISAIVDAIDRLTSAITQPMSPLVALVDQLRAENAQLRAQLDEAQLGLAAARQRANSVLDITGVRQAPVPAGG